MPQADAVRPVPSVPARPRSLERQAMDRDPAYELAADAVETGMSAFSLKALRGRAFTLANGLARRCGLDELVLPLPDHGLGFILRDVPGQQAGPEAARPPQQVYALWWQLAACSEVTVAPPDQIVPRLPADFLLRRALETHNHALLLEQVPVSGPGHTGYELWCTLHEQDWNDLVRLLDNYRRIRRGAAEAGIPLWGSTR